MIYIEAEDIVEFNADLRKFKLPIVFDHMVRVRIVDGLDSEPFKLLLDFMRNEDVWVKISCAERLSHSSPPYDDVVPFAQAVIETNPERALWGTDFPSGVTGANDSSLRSSAGFGILWDTAIGPLSFYWADAVKSKSYDKTRRFQFNIGTRL